MASSNTGRQPPNLEELKKLIAAPWFQVYPAIVGTGATSSCIQSFLSLKGLSQDIYVVGIVESDKSPSLLPLLSDRVKNTRISEDSTEFQTINAYFSLYNPYPGHYSVLFLRLRTEVGEQALTEAVTAFMKNGRSDFERKLFLANPNAWFQRMDMEYMKALMFLFLNCHTLLFGRSDYGRSFLEELKVVDEMKSMYIQERRGPSKERQDGSSRASQLIRAPLLFLLSRYRSGDEERTLESKFRKVSYSLALSAKSDDSVWANNTSRFLFSLDPACCVIPLAEERGEKAARIYQHILPGALSRREAYKKGNVSNVVKCRSLMKYSGSILPSNRGFTALENY